MKVSIISGAAEGPTKLNSFDNALLNAGIGDVNLIKVSSILPARSEIIELPQLEGGAMVNCVLSQAYSERSGDLITAAIAVAQASELGCVVENSGINLDPSIIQKETEDMARYMMKVRGLKYDKLVTEMISHEVQEKGCVVAALVYLGE